MDTCFQLLGKLVRSVNGGIHLTTQLLFRALECRGERSKRHVADDHEIDVARRGFRAFGKGAIHERAHDAVGVWGERLSQHVGESSGLEEKPSELGKDRGLRVRLEIEVLALASALQNPGGDERRQFALQARRRHPQVTGQIGHVPPAVGMEERRRKDALASLREEGVERLCTHNA